MVRLERASSCGFKITPSRGPRRHPTHLAAQARGQGPKSRLAHQIKEVEEDIAFDDNAVAQLVPLAKAQMHDAARRRDAQQIVFKVAKVMPHASDPVAIAVAAASHEILAPLHIRQRVSQRTPQLRQAGFDATQLVNRVRDIQGDIGGESIASGFCQLLRRSFAQGAHDRHDPPFIGDIARLVDRAVLE